MADYIEREAAIEAARIWNGDESTEAWIQRNLEKIPAADVRPVVRGKWIRIQDELCECSECARYWIPFGDAYDFHFCPNCGAIMSDA